MGPVNKLTMQNSSKEKPSDEPQSQSESLIGTYLISNMGVDSKQDKSINKIPINFYISRLTNENNLTYGFLMIMQPIVIS